MSTAAVAHEIELADEQTIKQLIESVQAPSCGRRRLVEVKTPQARCEDPLPMPMEIAAVFFVQIPTVPDRLMTTGGVAKQQGPPPKWRTERLLD